LAAGTPVTIVKLERSDSKRFKPHTSAMVVLNGKSIRAVFDSGAQSSVPTLAAARRVSITPESPDGVPAGMGGGIGSKQVRP
jgi:predicted aspartyl protease